MTVNFHCGDTATPFPYVDVQKS